MSGTKCLKQNNVFLLATATPHIGWTALKTSLQTGMKVRWPPKYLETLCSYMRKGGDTRDYVPANFLDFPPNFRLRTRFQAILGNFRQFLAILGHFRPFLGQIFRQFFFQKRHLRHITHFFHVWSYTIIILQKISYSTYKLFFLLTR